MRRLRSGRPVVNLSLLLDDVLGGRKPLAWEELGHTPAPMHVVATDTADLTAHTLTGMASVADWRVVLQASASIPLLAGPPVAWGGRHWVDGSVGEPLAIERALRGGATHVLVMLCRGADDLHEDADAGLSLWARTSTGSSPGWARSRRVPGATAWTCGWSSRGSALGRPPVRDRPGALGGRGGADRGAGAIGEAVRIGDESATAALDAVAGSWTRPEARASRELRTASGSRIARRLAHAAEATARCGGWLHAARRCGALRGARSWLRTSRGAGRLLAAGPLHVARGTRPRRSGRSRRAA